MSTILHQHTSQESSAIDMTFTITTLGTEIHSTSDSYIPHVKMGLFVVKTVKEYNTFKSAGTFSNDDSISVFKTKNVRHLKLLQYPQ